MPNYTHKEGKGETSAARNYASEIAIYAHLPIPEEALSDCTAYANRIIALLQKRNMTQSDFAACAGVSNQTISNLLSNDSKRQPKRIDRDRVRLFAAILGCSPFELLGIDPPEQDRNDLLNPAMIMVADYPLRIIDCLKDIHDDEFTKCVCEIAKKSQMDPTILIRAKNLLKNGNICDPDNFSLEITPWFYDK